MCSRFFPAIGEDVTNRQFKLFKPFILRDWWNVHLDKTSNPFEIESWYNHVSFCYIWVVRAGVPLLIHVGNLL